MTDSLFDQKLYGWIAMRNIRHRYIRYGTVHVLYFGTFILGLAVCQAKFFNWGRWEPFYRSMGWDGSLSLLCFCFACGCECDFWGVKGGGKEGRR